MNISRCNIPVAQPKLARTLRSGTAMTLSHRPQLQFKQFQLASAPTSNSRDVSCEAVAAAAASFDEGPSIVTSFTPSAASRGKTRQDEPGHLPCKLSAKLRHFLIYSLGITFAAGFPSWLAGIRAAFFYLTTFAFAAPLFVVMLAVYPFVMVFDKFRRRAEHVVNNIWAKLTTLFYYPVKITGLENLPGPNQAAVYVSNHQSFLDIYTLFHLNRDFKFISKTSNFLIPIIGWSMFLTGHVMINRVDRRSQLECLKQCGELLKRGASVLFFPEGTRSKDGKMHAFKKGAFSVAAKAGVPIIPITLLGTGDLMPNTCEYLLYPGKVDVIIHPPVPASDADTMMNASYTVIAESLPPGSVAEE